MMPHLCLFMKNTMYQLKVFFYQNMQNIFVHRLISKLQKSVKGFSKMYNIVYTIGVIYSNIV